MRRRRHGSEVQQFSQTLFEEGWCQLRLLVTEQDVCLCTRPRVDSKPLLPALGIFINGQTQIGKHSGKEETVQFDVQKLRIYCSPEQNTWETAREIPGFRGGKGEPGVRGTAGLRGQAGDMEPPGLPEDGKPGTEFSEQFIRQVCTDVLRTQLPAFLQSGGAQNCDRCHSQRGAPGGPVGLEGP
ncbi:LOW QUALITY PROTEIN: collagen alpha-1(XXI) chain [Thomomys bottae]